MGQKWAKISVRFAAQNFATDKKGDVLQVCLEQKLKNRHCGKNTTVAFLWQEFETEKY